MVRLIINADDFGIDENRTKAILEGFRRGIVTHTTALVTMPYFEEGVKMITAAGHLDQMGLHLNLTEGCALAEPMRKCRFFCDDKGNFQSQFHNKWKYRLYLPREVRLMVEKEARAQMQRFRDCGGVSNHLDSHHHVHTDISVARIILPIAKEYGFTSFRLSRNIGNNLSLTKRLYKLWFNKLYACGPDFWSDYMCDFRGFKDCISHVAAGQTLEMMVHPMYGNLKNLSMMLELTDSGRPMANDRKFYDSLSSQVETFYPNCRRV